LILNRLRLFLSYFFQKRIAWAFSAILIPAILPHLPRLLLPISESQCMGRMFPPVRVRRYPQADLNPTQLQTLQVLKTCKVFQKQINFLNLKLILPLKLTLPLPLKLPLKLILPLKLPYVFCFFFFAAGNKTLFKIKR